jgi:hypothetical protein
MAPYPVDPPLRTTLSISLGLRVYQAHVEPGSGPLGEFSADEAKHAVLGVPLLAVIEEALHWTALFEPSVGSLRSFLHLHAADVRSVA